ncbi:hypothetical protein [Rickettsiella endosymbiont of Litargus connexus]
MSASSGSQIMCLNRAHARFTVADDRVFTCTRS